MKIDRNFEFKPPVDCLDGVLPTLEDILREGLEYYGLDSVLDEYIEQLEWHHTSFKDKWAGRTFKCNDTGVEFTIPETVKECDFFPVGNGFIDVGRNNFYCRMGGNIEEIKE